MRGLASRIIFSIVAVVIAIIMANKFKKIFVPFNDFANSRFAINLVIAFSVLTIFTASGVFVASPAFGADYQCPQNIQGATYNDFRGQTKSGGSYIDTYYCDYIYGKGKYGDLTVSYIINIMHTGPYDRSYHSLECGEEERFSSIYKISSKPKAVTVTMSAVPGEQDFELIRSMAFELLHLAEPFAIPCGSSDTNSEPEPGTEPEGGLSDLEIDKICKEKYGSDYYYNLDKEACVEMTRAEYDKICKSISADKYYNADTNRCLTLAGNEKLCKEKYGSDSYYDVTVYDCTRSPVPKISTSDFWVKGRDCLFENNSKADEIMCLKGLLGDPKTDPDAWAMISLAYMGAEDYQNSLQWAKKTLENPGSEISLDIVKNNFLELLCDKGVAEACSLIGKQPLIPPTIPKKIFVEPPAPAPQIREKAKPLLEAMFGGKPCNVVIDKVRLLSGKEIPYDCSEGTIQLSDDYTLKLKLADDWRMKVSKEFAKDKLQFVLSKTPYSLLFNVVSILDQPGLAKTLYLEFKTGKGEIVFGIIEFEVTCRNPNPDNCKIWKAEKVPEGFKIEQIPAQVVGGILGAKNVDHNSLYIFTDYPIADTAKVKERVPGWIKNNAGWWAEGQIGDSDFVGGIQHLIKEKIINIPDLPEQASGTAEEKVPGWIKNNAGWWADGQIGEDDFVNGIKWLVENGIIRV